MPTTGNLDQGQLNNRLMPLLRSTNIRFLGFVAISDDGVMGKPHTILPKWLILHGL